MLYTESQSDEKLRYQKESFYSASGTHAMITEKHRRSSIGR